jgi:hypothetical protein
MCGSYSIDIGYPRYVKGGKPMIKTVHPLAGGLAILIIGVFWTSTVLGELFATPAGVAAVKSAIAWGLLLLMPTIAAAGGTGFKLAGDRRAGPIGAKARRMPLIAANGILVLVPSALFLASKAKAAEFDAHFYAIQGLELLAGAVNITLLGLNIRDGLKMKGKSGHRRT